MFNLSKTSFALFLILLIPLVVYFLQSVLQPFLIAALLAYLTAPLIQKMAAKGSKPLFSIGLIFSLLFCVLIAAFVLILPQLSRQLKSLLLLLPQLIEFFNASVLPWLELNLSVDLASVKLNLLQSINLESVKKTGDFAAQILSGLGASSMSLLSTAFNFILIPVVSFYLLRDWDVLLAKLQGLLPPSRRQSIQTIVLDCHQVLAAFVRGQLLVILALGVLYSLGLSLIGLDLALVVGFTAGLLSIVPYMGLVVGLVLASIAALIQFSDASILAWVLLVFVLVQLLETVWLTPMLIGDKIGLHPVAVIFAIMAGGHLFGLVGVLLALPIAAVIRVLLQHMYRAANQPD